MNSRNVKPSVAVVVIVALLLGSIFIPRILFVAIFVLLGTAFALGAIHFLMPVFSRTRADAMRWGGASSPRMSRLSLLLISALLGCTASWIFIRGFAARRPDPQLFFIATLSLIVLVFIGRWLDTGKWTWRA